MTTMENVNRHYLHFQWFEINTTNTLHVALTKYGENIENHWGLIRSGRGGGDFLWRCE